jgi:hypothetical protein
MGGAVVCQAKAEWLWQDRAGRRIIRFVALRYGKRDSSGRASSSFGAAARFFVPCFAGTALRG